MFDETDGSGPLFETRWLERIETSRLFSLRGKVAIVTGGAGGIGRWLSAGLATAGAAVVVTDRDAKATEAVAGALVDVGLRAVPLVVDLENGDAAAQIVGATVERLGRVDVLINNAGINARIPMLEVTTELDIHAYFAKAFGVPALRGPCLSAYNNFLPVTDPDTGEKVHLFGVWINPPGGHGTDLGRSAWYLIRHSDGSYGHGRVFDPDHPRPNPPRGLLSTRTIEVSPFPEDKGRTLYFGGYDPANIDSHNTAWIYKAALRPVESKKEGR